MTATAVPPREGASVQIVACGFGNLVFINGQRVNDVLKVELPVKPEEIAPQVVLTLWAKEVRHTRVSPEEWKQLQATGQLHTGGMVPQDATAFVHTGEAIVPGKA